MPSNYKGLYVICTNGKVTDVQVEDTGGNSMPLPLNDYLIRGVKPEWRDLPLQDEYGSPKDPQPLVLARRQAQAAANHYQNLVDRQIDDLRTLQWSGWTDTAAMGRVDASIPKLEQARSECDQWANKYFEAGGMEPIYVQSRHSLEIKIR